jgi:NitT/TauT family transport system substrate-binding protein
LKHIVLYALIVFLGVPFYGLTIYAPKAPPSIPLLRAAEVMKNIRVVLYDDVQSQVLPRILRDSGNLYIIPSNMAAKLYNKGIDIRLMGVTTLGLLYLISADSNILKMDDIDGKQVSIGEPGSSPDVVARRVFSVKKIKPSITYGSTPEIAGFLIAGRIKTAVLPEPYATLVLDSLPSARRIGDFRRMWETLKQGDGIPQAALVGKAGFIQKNREEIDNFIFNYKESVSWTHNLPQRSSALGVKKLGLKISAPALARSFPYMNLTFISGKASKNTLSDYFTALMGTDPQSVGEKVPDENFFTE